MVNLNIGSVPIHCSELAPQPQPTHCAERDLRGLDTMNREKDSLGSMIRDLVGKSETTTWPHNASGLLQPVAGAVQTTMNDSPSDGLIRYYLHEALNIQGGGAALIRNP